MRAWSGKAGWRTPTLAPRWLPVSVAAAPLGIEQAGAAPNARSCRERPENLSFTPWHSLPEHRPIGGINRVRKAVYLAVSTLRHRLNQAPRVEPTAVEAVP